MEKNHIFNYRAPVVKDKWAKKCDGNTVFLLIYQHQNPGLLRWHAHERSRTHTNTRTHKRTRMHLLAYWLKLMILEKTRAVGI